MSFTGKMTDDSEQGEISLIRSLQALPIGLQHVRPKEALYREDIASSNPLKNTETVVDLEIPSEGLQPKEGTGGIKRCSNWEVNMYKRPW